jgi:hypothetical protein
MVCGLSYSFPLVLTDDITFLSDLELVTDLVTSHAVLVLFLEFMINYYNEASLVTL